MKLLALLLLLTVCLLGIARLAFRPPSLKGRSETRALPISDRTSLGRAIRQIAQGHDHDSGVVPLHHGVDAFGARVALIREAQESLDLQYYIWQRDATGLALLTELRRAAERGVRVRLLVDDNGIAGLDNDLAALNALPTVEVRIFNPFIFRQPKSLGFLWDFVRLNRRMHNKMLTADGAATILGGRNIGNVYFAFGTGPHYLDTDVLAVGHVAADAGLHFDRYWSSRSAYPAERILTPAPDGLEQTEAAARAAIEAAGEHGENYRQSVVTTPLADDLLSGEVALDWAPVTLMSDDPAKGLGRVASRQLMFSQLMRILAQPASQVDIVSAYFVPGGRFTKRLSRLVAEGKRVRILTNSQEATDVLVVHSAYVKYRPDLIDAGVELYELRGEPAAPPEPRTPGAATRASLHSKTVAVDGQRIFIGSFNFDPRSVMLNTETGLLIESPRITRELTEGLDQVLPAVSYGPRRNASGRIVWNEPAVDDAVVVHAHEPGTNGIQRMTLWLLGRLPIEWLL